MNVVGYIRVSTEEQGDSGLSLEAQTIAIGREIESRGWGLAGILSDVGVSGSVPLHERPAGAELLRRLDAREADGLIVSRLDRLSRLALDLLGTFDRSKRRRWSLVILDVAVDTTTPVGKFLLTVLAAVAELERDFISQRTKSALAAKRAQGHRLGRPPDTAPLTEQLIRELRSDGMSYGAIANHFNGIGLPTVRGGKRWWKSSIADIDARMNGVT